MNPARQAPGLLFKKARVGGVEPECEQAVGEGNMSTSPKNYKPPWIQRGVRRWYYNENHTSQSPLQGQHS